MEELQKQIEMLAQTMKIAVERLEQLFKMLEAKSNLLSDQAAAFKETTDNLQITDEALKRSLSEVDQQIDDLASITAALLEIQQKEQQQQAAS